MNTVTIQVELNDGTETGEEFPEKLPAVTGMEVRDKIKIGFQGDASGGGQVQVENAQSVKNDAQQYLASELLQHHTEHELKDVTLETVDRIWEHYAPQVNGKKKESSDQR